MKEHKEFNLLILLAVLLAFWIGFLSSCSDAKQAQKGYNKFIKNGGKIECKTDTLTITEVIKGHDGKDSIVYRDMQYTCPEIEMPKTRWQTRIEYRYKKSKDKLIYKTLFRTKKVYIKDQKVKSKFRFKQENKNNKKFSWYHYTLFVVFFVLGAYLRGVIASIFYVIKNSIK